MLPFIGYSMTYKAGKGFFLWELSTRDPRKIISMGFYCTEGFSLGSSLIIIFSICVISDPVIEKLKFEMIHVSCLFIKLVQVGDEFQGPLKI